MTTVQVADAGGDTLTFMELEGQLYPAFPSDAITKLDSFKIRHDDVIVCAYPKSGTHWAWEIVRMLQAGNTNLEPVEKDQGFMELFDQEHFEALPSPRALNTHVLFSKLPAEVKEKKCKVIFMSRNPKDTTVSYYHHHFRLKHLYNYNGEWKNYLQLILDGKVDYGSWFDYIQDWEATLKDHTEVPMLHISFEDIKEDPFREVSRMARFLDKDYSDDFIHSVCECCNFTKMKEQKGHFETTAEGKPIMYRKGEVGDWKNWFTVAMNEWFDRVYQDKMAASQLKFRYTLD